MLLGGLAITDHTIIKQSMAPEDVDQKKEAWCSK